MQAQLMHRKLGHNLACGSLQRSETIAGRTFSYICKKRCRTRTSRHTRMWKLSQIGDFCAGDLGVQILGIETMQGDLRLREKCDRSEEAVNLQLKCGHLSYVPGDETERG